MPPLILASSSPQRKLVMDSLGVEYWVEPSDIDEKAIGGDSTQKRVQAIAQAKGVAVAQKFPESMVIAADSIIALGEKSLEKPVDLQQAREMLQLLSGQRFCEYTAHWCALAQGALKPTQAQLQQASALAGTQIKLSEWQDRYVLQALICPEAQMRQLSAENIEKYVQLQPVTTWAGGFSPAYPAGAGLMAQLHGSFTGFAFGFAAEVVSAFLSLGSKSD